MAITLFLVFLGDSGPQQQPTTSRVGGGRRHYSLVSLRYPFSPFLASLPCLFMDMDFSWFALHHIAEFEEGGKITVTFHSTET